MKNMPFYRVNKIKQNIKIDGVWQKDVWKSVESLSVNNYLGNIPPFCPSVKVKLLYNYENLFVIYQVKDCYVSCLEQHYNGPVSNDACVEFFFSPDINLLERYFNLEVNCGGTPLMRYNVIPRKKYKTLGINDICHIEIAHSLPSKVEVEITEPVTWTIEYKIPFSLLQKFSDVTLPRPGVSWRANFYKVAAKGSNPHWITWSFIDSLKPDFHLPQYFGLIKFK